MDSVWFGALLAGLIIGAVPAISGGVKGKIGLGLAGLASCVVGSFILGMILSIPLCAIFMYLIFKKDTKHPSGAGQASLNSRASGDWNASEEVQKLVDLKASGVISEEEFQKLKEQLFINIK